MKSFGQNEFLLNNEEDFYCIGKNIEKSSLADIDAPEFIYQTIRQLLPLYEACHR